MAHRAGDVARLVALAAIWGASFVFMRVVAPALGPVWTAALRLLIGGATLVAWFALAGVDAGLRRHWRAYLLIGIVNSALPFVLYAFAALRLPASYMVVLNASVPLFASLLAPFWLGETLTRAKLAGLAAGIGGVALLSGAGPLAVDAGIAMSIAACLGASLCYAASAIWIKRNGAELKPIAIAGWSQLLAGLALLPLAALQPRPTEWTATIVANLLALALLCSAIAYLLYYRLIRDLGPTRAATVTLLMPGFGILWGALFLGETITLSMLAGMALVLAGVSAVFRSGSAK